jgi:GTP-binding protein
LNKSIEIFQKWNTRITTGILNKFLEKFLKNVHIPERSTQIKYLSQIKVRPPTFCLFLSKGIKKYHYNIQVTKLKKILKEN